MNDDNVVFYNDGEIELNVSINDETTWLNRNQISQLLDRDVKTIGKHINNIFKEKELEKNAVVANFATTAKDGKKYDVEYYNLDVVISIGYRVKSQRGVRFRQWATSVLKSYITDGYAINSDIIRDANTSITLIDNYIDDSTLTLFSKNQNIKVTIYTHTFSKQLKLDLEKYNSQYNPITIKTFKNSHDRFMIVDDTTVYHIGASLKDLGKKWFAFSKIGLDVEDILEKLK